MTIEQIIELIQEKIKNLKKGEEEFYKENQRLGRGTMPHGFWIRRDELEKLLKEINE